jgi:hypothetical protein
MIHAPGGLGSLSAIYLLDFLIATYFQQFQDGDDDVVHVTEAGGLKLLGVVKPSGPVDGDVTLVKKYEFFSYQKTPDAPEQRELWPVL